MVATCRPASIIGRPLEAHEPNRARPTGTTVRHPYAEDESAATYRSSQASFLNDGIPPVPMRLTTNRWSAPRPRHLLAAAGPRQAAGSERAGAAGLLLLALATFGCSTSSDDGAGPAIEEPASTTEAAQPEPPPTTQTAADQPDPPPTTTQPEPAPTTTQPDPTPSTTQPVATPEAVASQDEPWPDDDDDDPRAAGDSSAEPDSDGTSASELSEPEDSESESAFEAVNTAAFPELVRQRLLPWGDGFLHLGYLPASTLGESCSFGQLRTRFSTDGVEWSEFSDLDVPSVHTKPTLLSQLGLDDLDCLVKNYRSTMRISADGERFVIASQWPTYLDTWDGRSASDAAWLDQLLENPPSISLSITTNLVDWETIDIPLPGPEGLHASLHAAPRLVGMSLSQHGWLLELRTVTYMNLFSLMPADIRESAHRIEPRWDGPWRDESTGEPGMTVEWWTDEASRRDPHTRFISWEELGTTEELYDDYGVVDGRIDHPSSRLSSSIIAASWGESSKQFDLPDGYICCNTVGTESGYVRLSDRSLGGYRVWEFGPSTMHFSSDGTTWDVLGPITRENAPITSIRAVNSGIVAFRSLSEQYAWALEDDPDLVRPTIYWLGDPDGSDWREIELPEGTALIEWLMANDRTPIDWPHMAVNGNIVLRIGDNGGIDRYVVPG